MSHHYAKSPPNYAESSPAGLTLREARAQDRPILVRFLQEMGDRPGNPRPDAQTSEARLALMLSVDHDAWLIECDGRAIGYVLARENGDHVYIRHFLIARRARGDGVARAALDLLDEAYGEPMFRLDVMDGDHEAMAFWREMGFAPHGVHMRREAEGA